MKLQRGARHVLRLGHADEIAKMPQFHAARSIRVENVWARSGAPDARASAGDCSLCDASLQRGKRSWCHRVFRADESERHISFLVANFFSEHAHDSAAD